ncbi:MAG: DNA mismatch repair endonuclease MutL [Tannerellaceae bacterium]|jgi:DNA mismatch repair protein MutL|nr:DNA mismatch repair endonuclease MutL [Tannerellaceae bacterium]
MSDIIHLLPEGIANQIAAGEVIQRPASVVKELIENAVDAGASVIKVHIKDAGRTLVQVSDDGKGMSETDARMAFERHATSKIGSADDLFALRTLGFRGEALASIAAVAQVELRTRERGEEVGRKLEIAGSQVVKTEADGCGQGSVFAVRNLFYNVPARRKFLKANETEFRHILQEFERVALVYPDVCMELWHQGTEALRLPATNLRQRIVDTFGKGLGGSLLSVDVETGLGKISGFVGHPDATRKRALQYFFVNGRFMRHGFFHKAVMQAYEGLILAGEMPHYFLYFQVTPSEIDVNIHPTKTEIKFENELPLRQILLSSVRESLAKSSAIPTIDFDRGEAVNIPVYVPSTAGEHISAPSITINQRYNPFIKPQDWDTTWKPESENGYSTTPKEEAPPETTVFTWKEQQGISYQYRNKYIVTPLSSGLALIDQRRAHIRVLYDSYRARAEGKETSVSQRLLFPEEITWTPEEEALLRSLEAELRAVGFNLQEGATGSWTIDGIPSGMEHADVKEILRKILTKVMETDCEIHGEIHHILALTLAKAGASQYGQPLGAEERDHLIASLFSSTDSNLTPEGKTILTLLTDEELSRRFS